MNEESKCQECPYYSYATAAVINPTTVPDNVPTVTVFSDNMVSKEELKSMLTEILNKLNRIEEILNNDKK